MAPDRHGDLDDPAPRPRSPWQIAAAAGAASAMVGSGLALLYGPGYAGYDAAWSLVWGGELAGGALPSYTASIAPTPHPLANALAAPLSLLPDGGEGALVALTFLAFGALVVATALLAQMLYGRSAAIVAAGLLATSSVLAREAAFASVDVPFAALVVAALALETRRPGRGEAVLVLLLAAGLLRPEGWLLAAAYAFWMVVRGVRGARLARLLALAAAGPLLWVAGDALVTGNPLHSLQGTRALAAELQRPRGIGTALDAIVPSLRELLGDGPLLAGIAGLAIVAVAAPRRRSGPLLAVIAIGVLAFLAIAAADLPVLLRYLLIPACLLTVVAAGGLVTAVRSAGRTAPGVAAAIAAATVAALLVASIAPALDELRDARAFTGERGDVHRDLREIAGAASFQAAAESCGGARIPDFRSRPVLLLDVRAEPETLLVANLADGEPGLLLTYASERAEFTFNLGAPGEVRRQAAPAGARAVAANDSWRAFASGC